MTGWRTWRVAMAEALYGAGGFYRSPGAPGRHFRTAAHASPDWAAAIAALAHRVDAALGSPAGFTVVDLGSGGGELVAALAAQVPPRWRLVGVDVAPRPEGLADRIEWTTEPPRGVHGLLVAVEWLDVVPVDAAERAADGWRQVQVAADGTERLGPALDHDDDLWLGRWWPATEPGSRAEIGRSRDDAWAAAVGRLSRGVAVAVDYAAVPERDVAGTLTGYRGGRQVRPAPDGTCDLTAHVLFESCAAAVGNGARTRLLRQREALRALGVSGTSPPYPPPGSGADAADYVRALAAASRAAELLDPHGLGDFRWLVHAKGVPLPL